MQRLFLALLLIWISCGMAFVVDQTGDSISDDELYEMSLSELMNVKIISGSLTRLRALELPVARTVISRQDIEMTPARNLLDLLEIYTPSATFVNHWNGPRLGIRGIIGDQNTSFLLLVNGVNVNMYSLNGPMTEFWNRDLSDIELIEIIRGPGSVTYGAGAIGGLIHIHTLEAQTENSAELGVSANAGYRYGGAHLKLNGAAGQARGLFYASVNQSSGLLDPKFYYVDRAHGYGYGFMNENWGNKNLGTPAPPFYADYRDEPQLKFQFDGRLGEAWKVWARYTRASFIKQQQTDAVAGGRAFPGQTMDQFISALNYHQALPGGIEMESSLGFESLSYREAMFYQGDGKPANDITQRNASFAENDWFLKTRLRFSPWHRLKVAAGAEYRRRVWRPEWGMDSDTFILGFQAPIRFAVYDSTSGFYQQYGDAFCTLVGEPLQSNRYSGFFEANLELHPGHRLLVSGRADKHEYSAWAFSPRLALLSHLSDDHVIKAVYQHSVRIPSFVNLYSEQQINGADAAPEILRGGELMLCGMPASAWRYDASLYYYTVDQRAWTQAAHSDVVGTFDLVGVDLAAEMEYQNGNIGGSYSFIRQLRWDAVYPISAFVDVDLSRDEIDPVYLTDYGSNRINNLPRHMAKIYFRRQLPYRLNLHLDGRFYADYQQIDMLKSFLTAHHRAGTPETREKMQEIYDDLREHGYTRPSFTANLGLSWRTRLPFADLTLSAFVMNLINVNHIRYVFQYWQAGNTRQYPRQCGFVEEPTVIAFKTRLTF